MRRNTLLFILSAAALCAEEKVDLQAVYKIKNEAFRSSKVMEHAFYLTDVYGPRLTGSPGLKAAEEWAVRRFNEWGLAAVKLEKWGPFGRGWANLRLSAQLKEPQFDPLIATARPWSPGTNGPVSAQVVLAVLSTDADFEKAKGKLKDKIVFIDAPPSLPLQTSPQAKIYNDADLANESLALTPSANSYVGSTNQPVQRPSRAAANRFRDKLNRFLTEEGAVVAVSCSQRADGGAIRATAAGSRNEKDPLPPPSLSLTPEHYNRVARLLEKRVPVTLEIDIQSKFYDDDKNSYNVTAELPGSDKKDEIVMIGAHLDSWTFGTGATDNAAGSAVVMEAIRILKAAGLQPRRTIRAALWSGEEQGLLGSRHYVTQHFADRETMQPKPEHSKLAAYFNLDNGSGKVRGVYLQSNDMVRPIFEAWLAPFKDLGATALTIRTTGGTDHLSFDAVGLPGFQFIQDPLEYSTRTHHTNMDVYDHLQKTDLQQAAAIMASFAYHAAMREEMLPRKPLPKPQAESGLHSDVEFRKIGNISLTLDAEVPEGDGPFPAAILVHGGGWENGDKQTYIKPLFDPLSQANYVWFSINYRLSSQAKYPAPVDDVEKAIAWVRANAARYKVDPGKIALIGESAGGHLVSMVGVRNRPESRLQAVVAFYGPHDLEKRAVDAGSISPSVQKLVGVSELSEKSRALLREASPIAHVGPGLPPFLMIHGTKDAAVPYEQSPLMCEKLKAAGNSCEVVTIETAPHGMTGWEKTPEFTKYKPKMIDWLNSTLR